jgi:hypothetical protein
MKTRLLLSKIENLSLGYYTKPVEPTDFFFKIFKATFKTIVLNFKFFYLAENLFSLKSKIGTNRSDIFEMARV